MKTIPSLADLKRTISDPYGYFEERNPELRDAVRACAVPHRFDELLGLHILDAIRQDGRARTTLERIKHLPFVYLYALKGWQFEPEARKYFIELLERDGFEAEELNEAIAEHLKQRCEELTSNGQGKADRNVRELELRCIYHTFPVDENVAMDGLLQFDDEAIGLGREVDQRATEKVCLEQKRWISERLVEFWFFEGRHHYVRGEFETAEEFFRKVRESGQRTRIAGIAIHLLGHILWKKGELPEAQEVLCESEAIWREIGDRPGLAQTLNTLGCVLRDRAKLPEAEEVLRESEAIRREIGDRPGLAQTLNTLGCVLRDRGELPEAEEVLRGGEAILREIGDRPSLAQTLNTLGCVLRDRRKLPEAEEVLRESEAILTEIGDRPSLAQTLNTLGCVLRDRRKLPEAEEVLCGGEAIWREIGDGPSLAQTLNTLGCVLRDRGKLPEAEEVLRGGEAILREIGDRPSLAQTLNTLGSVLRDRGELPEAEEVLCESEAIRREIGDRPGLAQTLNTLGSVLRDRGELPEAEEVLCDSEAIRREIGDRPGLAQTLNTLGCVLRDQGKLPEAEEVLRESEAIGREIGDLCGLAMVLSALGRIYESEELWDRAEDAYSESIKLNEELGYDKSTREMESSLRRVHRKRQQGRTANLQRHVREHPEDAHSRATLIVLLQESDPDEALKVAHEGMEITPDNSKLSSAYIDLLITLQKWYQAEEEARALLQRPPDDLDRQTRARVWNSLGNILTELEKYEEAEDCYRKSQQLGMPEVQIQNNLGLLYARKAEKAREPSEAKGYSIVAEDHFLAAIEGLYTKTNFVWPYLNLAELYIVQKRYSEANGQLRIVGDKHPAALKFDDIQAKYEDLLARIRANVPNSA